MANRNKIETPEQKAKREAIEKIAANLSQLAEAVASLMAGPLNKRALIVLLASSSGESQERVKTILEALQNLKSDWLNKK